MSKALAQVEADEKAAITSHDQLMVAKTKELDANTNAIETKSTRVGQLAVEIVQLKNDLADTEAGLSEDKKFLADMDNNCAAQAKEWDERSSTRSQELLAIAETIKVLNDDDALELFKKTIPSSSSFMQISSAATRQRALSMIDAVRRKSSHRPQFDFIALAMQGKAAGWAKVIKMIDGMLATLKEEQNADDHKSEYCHKQFDSSDDKKKGLARSISDLEISIDEANEGIATLKEEIEGLEERIKDLDNSVTEATEQRKSEHADFTEMMASDSAAKELLKFAINRLNKFYNPKLYKAQSDASGGQAVLAEVSAHDAPSPPPATFDAYSKKSEESGGVIKMIQLLVQDLDKEMQEATVEEENAQKTYEQ